MDSQKQQIIDRLKQANNVLVTVKSDPSIDQLAACIGLTLVLNEQGKHATAVFSGEVPSVLEFLEPEKTLESNTDSLRDFIISLDKSKADKLRYKVEDKVVKIFITPYRTSIDEEDLEFSQGDFNVDVVVALGVHEQDELDQAVTSHGRILHDASTVSLNTVQGNNIGSANWVDEKASSLSEMVASIAGSLGKKDVLDNQIATALLTGIVSETERFSNGKTSPQTMSTAAKLLTAGANQELVASKLAEPEPEPEEEWHEPGDDGESSGPEEPDNPPPEPPKSDDGALSIDHTEEEQAAQEQEPEISPESESLPPPEEEPHQPIATTSELPLPEPQPMEAVPPEEQAAMELLKNRQINIDDRGKLQIHHPVESEHREFLGNSGHSADSSSPDQGEQPAGVPFDSSKFGLSEPVMGGTLTANSRPERLDPSTDPLSAGRAKSPILSHNAPGTALQDRSPARHVVQPSTASPATPAPAMQPPVADTPQPFQSAPTSKPETPPPPELIAPAGVPEQRPEQPPEPDLVIKAPEPETPAEPASSKMEAVLLGEGQAPTPAQAPAPTDPSRYTAETLTQIERETNSPHLTEEAKRAEILKQLAPAPKLEAAMQEPTPPVAPKPAGPPVKHWEQPTAASTNPANQPKLEAAVAEPQAPKPETEQASAAKQPTSLSDILGKHTPNTPAATAVKPEGPHLEAQTLDMPLPPTINLPPSQSTSATNAVAASPAPPPPVPPPMMPPAVR